MSIFTSLLKPITALASEFIEDKDKSKALAMRMQELVESSVKSAREHDKASYGNKYIDGIRGLVRPLITVAFAGNYITAEEAFTSYDYAILGMVLGFWFGGRELQKLFKSRGK